MLTTKEILDAFQATSKELAEHVRKHCGWEENNCWWIGPDREEGISEYFVEAIDMPLSIEQISTIAEYIVDCGDNKKRLKLVGSVVEEWAILTTQAYAISPSLMRPNLRSWLMGWDTTRDGIHWKEEIQHLQEIKDKLEKAINDAVEEL